MNTIQSGWENFKKKTIPEQSSSVQFENAKMAFYNGALAVLVAYGNIEDDNNMKEEDAVKALQSIHMEVSDYFNSLMEGMGR